MGRNEDGNNHLYKLHNPTFMECRIAATCTSNKYLNQRETINWGNGKWFFFHPHWIYFHELIAFSPYLRMILKILKAKTLNKFLKSLHINNIFPFHSFLRIRVTTANSTLLLQYPYTLSSVQHPCEGLLFLLTGIYGIKHPFYFL